MTIVSGKVKVRKGQAEVVGALIVITIIFLIIIPFILTLYSESTVRQRVIDEVNRLQLARLNERLVISGLPADNPEGGVISVVISNVGLNSTGARFLYLVDGATGDVLVIDLRNVRSGLESQIVADILLNGAKLTPDLLPAGVDITLQPGDRLEVILKADAIANPESTLAFVETSRGVIHPLAQAGGPALNLDQPGAGVPPPGPGAGGEEDGAQQGQGLIPIPVPPPPPPEADFPTPSPPPPPWLADDLPPGSKFSIVSVRQIPPVEIGSPWAWGVQLVTDYPVRLVFDAKWEGWQVLKRKSDAGKVFVVDTYGSPLPFWIEEFNPSAKNMVLWVKLPYIPVCSLDGTVCPPVIIFVVFGADNPNPQMNSPYKVFRYFYDFKRDGLPSGVQVSGRYSTGEDSILLTKGATLKITLPEKLLIGGTRADGWRVIFKHAVNALNAEFNLYLVDPGGPIGDRIASLWVRMTGLGGLYYWYEPRIKDDIDNTIIRPREPLRMRTYTPIMSAELQLFAGRAVATVYTPRVETLDVVPARLDHLDKYWYQGPSFSEIELFVNRIPGGGNVSIDWIAVAPALHPQPVVNIDYRALDPRDPNSYPWYRWVLVFNVENKSSVGLRDVVVKLELKPPNTVSDEDWKRWLDLFWRFVDKDADIMLVNYTDQQNAFIPFYIYKWDYASREAVILFKLRNIGPGETHTIAIFINVTEQSGGPGGVFHNPKEALTLYNVPTRYTEDDWTTGPSVVFLYNATGGSIDRYFGANVPFNGMPPIPAPSSILFLETRPHNMYAQIGIEKVNRNTSLVVVFQAYGAEWVTRRWTGEVSVMVPDGPGKASVIVRTDKNYIVNLVFDGNRVYCDPQYVCRSSAIGFNLADYQGQLILQFLKYPTTGNSAVKYAITMVMAFETFKGLQVEPVVGDD